MDPLFKVAGNTFKHLCLDRSVLSYFVKLCYDIAGLQIIVSPERTYVLLRHHLGRTKRNCGRTSPTYICNHGRFLFIVAVEWFTIKYLSGHHVRSHLGFRRTWANFGRPMADDRQLFAALYWYHRNAQLLVNKLWSSPCHNRLL